MSKVRANLLATGAAVALASCGGGKAKHEVPAHTKSHENAPIAYVTDQRMENLVRPIAIKLASKAVALATGPRFKFLDGRSVSRSGGREVIDINTSRTYHGICFWDEIKVVLNDSGVQLRPQSVSKVHLSWSESSCNTNTLPQIAPIDQDLYLESSARRLGGLAQWSGFERFDETDYDPGNIPYPHTFDTLQPGKSDHRRVMAAQQIDRDAVKLMNNLVMGPSDNFCFKFEADGPQAIALNPIDQTP